MNENASLATVIGTNARAIRLENRATLDDVARAARRYGLKWTSGRVGDFEGGRMPATIPTLIAAAQALQDATGQPVSAATLLESSGSVKITDELTLTGEQVAASFRGIAPLELNSDIAPPGHTLTDWRVAREMGVSVDDLAALTRDAYGATFTEVRDRRAGPDANAQRRGQVTRQLKEELKERLGAPGAV